MPHQHQWLPSELIQGDVLREDVTGYIRGSVKAPTIYVVRYWCPQDRSELFLNEDFIWDTLERGVSEKEVPHD